MINKPLPLDYNGNPNIKALKERGFTTDGSTLPWKTAEGCRGYMGIMGVPMRDSAGLNLKIPISRVVQALGAGWVRL